MKSNHNGHNLAGTHAAMTSALTMSFFNTLLFPEWNEYTVKIIDIAEQKSSTHLSISDDQSGDYRSAKVIIKI
ncbi:hypothetical protein [Photorhabdus antumapuensis]|uniref:hypothetical protein n=1 Tax=Photorhabdus antumapuensis TaxID=2862867 RepID=UPI0037CBD45B|nr:hypothetical protein [Photorhabdus antumapuensis]